MAEALIEAIRARNLAGAEAALRADGAAARKPRAIVAAAGAAYLPALKLLHRHGADLNASYRNYRPLHNLIQERPHGETKPTRERIACLDWLLAHGADPELTAAWPAARAILVAAFLGEPVYVDRLRGAGARIDIFASAAFGDIAAIEHALHADTGLATARDSGTLTALHCAAGSRMPAAAPALVAIARLLLDAGADPRATARSWDHEVDAACLATGAGHLDIFMLLLERGADATEALAHAVWARRDALAEAALARGASLDAARSGGRPLLNDLIRWGQIPAMQWMLAHGASPNLPDGDGWTAVHQAASRGNLRILEAVLAAGGDPTRKDKLGHAPRDVAETMGRPKLVARFAAEG